MIEFSVKDIKVGIIQGDITALEVDAIVSPESKDLKMERGVAQAIRRIAGKSVEEEAEHTAPLSMGGVIATGAGNLAAKYVFHAAVIEKKYIEREVVRRAMQNVFNLANVLEIKSIAFPFLGSPIAKAPLDTFARLMLEETIVFIQQNETQLKNITFCLFNKEFYQFFVEQLDSLRQIYFF